MIYKIILPLIFFISLIGNSISQTAIITYTVESLNKKDSEIVNKVNAELELKEFTLSYDKTQSFFKQEKYIPKDELYSKLSATVIGAQFDYFQNSTLKEAIHNQEVSGKMYQVDYSFKMKDWKLTNESTTINDYTCYKAILIQYNKRTESNFEIVAWYTPNIPAGFGPIGYGGLPGIILQLQYKTFVYTATAITLNPKNVSLEKIRKGERVSVDKIVELMRAARKVTED